MLTLYPIPIGTTYMTVQNSINKGISSTTTVCVRDRSQTERNQK